MSNKFLIFRALLKLHIETQQIVLCRRQVFEKTGQTLLGVSEKIFPGSEFGAKVRELAPTAPLEKLQGRSDKNGCSKKDFIKKGDSLCDEGVETLRRGCPPLPKTHKCYLPNLGVYHAWKVI